MYCITHGLSNVTENEVCLFASCPPPELESDWHLHLTPPTPKELQVMELSAKELELQFS